MSTSPQYVAFLQGPCAYCGNYHIGVCPRVESIEYYPNRMVKKVTFYDTNIEYYPNGMVKKVRFYDTNGVDGSQKNHVV